MTPIVGRQSTDACETDKDWFESLPFAVTAWTVLCTVIAAQILGCLGAPLQQYDESIPLVSSGLIAAGHIPTVDFKGFYPPFYYYPVAAAFRIVSRSVLVFRYFSVALYLISTAAIVVFFRKSFPELKSLIPYMTLLVAIATGTVIYASWPGYALALLSLLVYLQSQNNGPMSWRWRVFSGALAGISTLVRYNFGAYVALVAGADIILTEGFQTTKEPLLARIKHALLEMAVFYGAFTIINLGSYFVVFGPRGVILEWQMMSYAMRVMSSHAFRQIRLQPNLLLLVFPYVWILTRKVMRAGALSGSALVPAAAAAALLTLALLGGSRPSISLWFPALSFLTVIALHLFVLPLPRPVVCLLFFYVCLQHYFLARADPDHSILFVPIAALTLPYLFTSDCISARHESERPIPKALVFLTLILLTCGMIVSRQSLRAFVTLARNTFTSVPRGVLDPRIPDRLRLPLTDSTLADEIQATEFVRQRTPASAPIFVGASDHSKGFMNDVRAYWLSERLPGVSFFHIDSAIASDEAAQREIVADLERNHVKWGILCQVASTFEKLPPASGILDDFLKKNFQEEAHFGRYSVIARRVS